VVNAGTCRCLRFPFASARARRAAKWKAEKENRAASQPLRLCKKEAGWLQFEPGCDHFGSYFAEPGWQFHQTPRTGPINTDHLYEGDRTRAASVAEPINPQWRGLALAAMLAAV